jgi:hypothetical protein
MMHASWVATNVLGFSLSILPVCATRPMKKPAKNTRKITKAKNKILEKERQQQKILEKRKTTAKKK